MVGIIAHTAESVVCVRNKLKTFAKIMVLLIFTKMNLPGGAIIILIRMGNKIPLVQMWIRIFLATELKGSPNVFIVNL
jgi:hypothetical protein